MPSDAVISQFERRLVEMGFPSSRVRREVLELTDHYEDLKSDAVEEGLDEAAAEARAEKLLGEPVALAEFLAAALRQSTWRGRHPFIAFLLLPPLVIMLLLSCCAGLGVLIGHAYFTPDQITALTDSPFGLNLCVTSFQYTYYAMVAFSVLLFCRAARETGSWLKWSLAACLASALHCLFFYIRIVPHEVSVGYANQSQWFCALIPVLLALAICAVHWRSVSLLQSLPLGAQSWRLKKSNARSLVRESPLPRARWLTLSSVIAALVCFVIFSFVISLTLDFQHRVARASELRTHVWPAERAAVHKQLATRQASRETENETTIDLTPQVNAALTDSMNRISDGVDNNLTELPQGIHVYDGVPFNIQGRVQLLGRRLTNTPHLLPAKAKNIVVNRSCQKIYILHGAAHVGEEIQPTAIARLILHYADGSHADIDINSGLQVRDWWGPIYQTDTNDQPDRGLAADSQLAWAGTNAHLHKQKPEASLRLYKTAFANPHPELQITSLDYVSTLTDAAPFMVGLTVE